MKGSRAVRVLLWIATVAITGLVAAGCGKFGTVDTGSTETTGSGTETTPDARVTDAKFDAAARTKGGCDEMVKPPDQGNRHVGSGEIVKYTENPPTSGTHDEAPAPWDFYDEPLPDEKWVHNLEHGGIVIAHKGLTDAQLEEQTEQAERSSHHVILTPRPKNPKTGVYYLAWTGKLYCKKPSPEALQHLIDEFRDRGPELVL